MGIDRSTKKELDKRFIGYHVTYHKVKDVDGKSVASISGHQIISNNELFEQKVLEGTDVNPELLKLTKQGEIVYSLISSKTNQPIAKVDKYFNVYSLDGTFLATLYNTHSELKFIIAFLVLLFTCICLGFIAINKTGDPFHPDFITITEADGQIVTDEWNIFPSKIYPGKSGSYYFNIKNEDSIGCDLFIDFHEVNFENIPLEYRIREKNTYYCGDENTWCKIDDAKLENLRFNAKQNRSFVLEWRWYDDGKRDEEDTAIGVQDSVEYKIEIKVVAQLVGKNDD